MTSQKSFSPPQPRTRNFTLIKFDPGLLVSDLAYKKLGSCPSVLTRKYSKKLKYQLREMSQGKPVPPKLERPTGDYRKHSLKEQKPLWEPVPGRETSI